MGIITTRTGRTLFKKAKALQVLPYVYDANLEDYVLGPNVYDISAVIGDSISCEQSDGDVTTKNNEFTPQPVVRNTTAGTWNFTAQVLDLQNNVLRALFGALIATETVSGATYHISAIPEDYQTRYALVRVSFRDNNTPDVYFPRMLLDSKLMINQLKTRGAQGNLNCVALSLECAIMSRARQGNLVRLSSLSGNKYMVRTPIMFVPQSYTPLFLHHQENGGYFFSQVDWEELSGSCATHNVFVASATANTYQIIP